MSVDNKNIVITSAVRTAIGTFRGSLKDMQANDIPVIPEIDYKSILNGSVSISQIAEIKRRGSLIIRGVFDEQLAREWNEEIVEYILRNDYYTKSIEKKVWINIFLN